MASLPLALLLFASLSFSSAASSSAAARSAAASAAARTSAARATSDAFGFSFADDAAPTPAAVAELGASAPADPVAPAADADVPPQQLPPPPPAFSSPIPSRLARFSLRYASRSRLSSSRAIVSRNCSNFFFELIETSTCPR